VTIVVPNVGEAAFLSLITDVDSTIRLFKTDVTAGLTPAQVDALDQTDFVEATFTGYSAVSMTTAWTVSPDDPSEATRPQVSFTSSANQAAQTIYGYYVTRNSDGQLRWFEDFAGPLIVENLGDAIVVTPTLTLDDDQEATLPPATVSNIQDGQFTTDSTVFGIDNDSGTYVDCGVTFVAAPTGRALIHWRASLDNNTAGQFTALSFVLRTGAVVGSGTIVLAANDARTVVNSGTDAAAAGMTYMRSGLTPGDTYNVRLEHHVGGGIGTILRREVIVAPAT
jgi:hypothetical protein